MKGKKYAVLYMFEILKDISAIIFLWFVIVSVISLSAKGYKAIDRCEKAAKEIEKSFGDFEKTEKEH